MADTGLKYHISLDKDSKDGTLCTLSFPEHELLLKYEIINKEANKISPCTEEVNLSSIGLQKTEPVESPKEIVEPETHPHITPSPLPESRQAEAPVELPSKRETRPYQRLIELILRIPGMKDDPQLRFSLLPKNLRDNLRVRPGRSKLIAKMDLENILVWAVQNNALLEVFANIKKELIRIENEDDRKKLREDLNEMGKSFINSKRNIETVQRRIPNEYRRYIRSNLNTHFNLEGIHMLCFDLGIDFDSLGGHGKTTIVISLLEEVERQDRVHELLKLCKTERPNVDWDC